MLCEWTSAEDLACVRDSGPAGGFELLLGADVCYGQAALPAVRQHSHCFLHASSFCSYTHQQQHGQRLECLSRCCRCSVLQQG